MKLINALASNSTIAVKMVMDFLSTPTLAGVLIYQETGKIRYENDISKQVIIDNTGGRKVIHDNFMPKPITWDIKGYLKPLPYEVSFYFQPSLKRQKETLEKARDKREEVKFKDKEGTYHQVGIELLEIDENAECQNGVPIRVILKKITIQSATSSIVSNIEAGGTPDTGSENGESQGLGTSLSDQLGVDKNNPDSLGVQLFGGGAYK